MSIAFSTEADDRFVDVRFVPDNHRKELQDHGWFKVGRDDLPPGCFADTYEPRRSGDLLHTAFGTLDLSPLGGRAIEIAELFEAVLLAHDRSAHGVVS